MDSQRMIDLPALLRRQRNLPVPYVAPQPQPKRGLGQAIKRELGLMVLDHVVAARNTAAAHRERRVQRTEPQRTVEIESEPSCGICGILGRSTPLKALALVVFAILFAHGWMQKPDVRQTTEIQNEAPSSN